MPLLGTICSSENIPQSLAKYVESCDVASFSVPKGSVMFHYIPHYLGAWLGAYTLSCPLFEKGHAPKCR